MHQSEGHGHHG